MSKKYKVADLNIHIYGKGRKKLFIMYTDYTYEDGVGPRWHTRVYPDIRGNSLNAAKQAIQWLNENEIGEPWVIRNRPEKLSLTYKWGW